ncbi:MAG: ATP-binding protein [Gammaproteobacteria bacterium]|nr:ATP-binding protein [Gammaproteobacteria bacterium]
MDKSEQVLARAERLLERIEHLLSLDVRETTWESAMAFRWRHGLGKGYLETVRHPHRVRLDDLHNIDDQKAEIDRNTRQFLAGLPANNVLLWGSRGTGKSSLIKALLTEYAGRGLRVIEVEAAHLADLPDIVDLVHGRPERFILFCDDLSFEADDSSYKALKAVLDGSLAGATDNLLVYATSNRRHLLPEYMGENEEARLRGGEIHHGEAVEEKISLSERFGLWLSFYPFSQDHYLDICFSWLKQLGAPQDDPEDIRREALRYALARGSRSGRVAWQFARDWAGRTALDRNTP